MARTQRTGSWLTAATLLLLAWGCQPTVEGELFRPLNTQALCGTASRAQSRFAEESSAPEDPSSISRYWDVSKGCVPVTYDADLVRISREINAALAAWTSPSCTRLCFVPASIGVDDEKEMATCLIHIRSSSNILPRLPSTPSEGGEAQITEALFRAAQGSDQGQILGARVQLLSPELPGGATRLLTHALGHAIGFNDVETGSPSIMSPLLEEWPAAGLSPKDVAAVLDRYGVREGCQ